MMASLEARCPPELKSCFTPLAQSVRELLSKRQTHRHPTVVSVMVILMQWPDVFEIPRAVAAMAFYIVYSGACAVLRMIRRVVAALGALFSSTSAPKQTKKAKCVAPPALSISTRRKSLLCCPVG